MSCNYCFKCGADLAEDAKVCPSCGLKLEKLVNEPFVTAVPVDRPQKSEPEPEEPEQLTEGFQPSPRSLLKRQVIGVIIVINSLLGLDVYIRDTYKVLKKASHFDRLIIVLIFDLLFLITLFIGNRIVRDGMLAEGKRLVMKKATVLRKVSGVIIALAGAAGGFVTIVSTVNELRDTYGDFDPDDIIGMFTADLLAVIIVWLGISQFFPTMEKQKPGS